MKKSISVDAVAVDAFTRGPIPETGRCGELICKTQRVRHHCARSATIGTTHDCPNIFRSCASFSRRLDDVKWFDDAAKTRRLTNDTHWIRTIERWKVSCQQIFSIQATDITD